MSNEHKDTDVCEACGCVAEIGYVIGEGDIVATVTISAENAQQRQARLDEYLNIARSINDKVTVEVSPNAENSNEITAKLQFEVTAEKIIFELKSRDLNS